jgi:hypothetical protein
MIFPKLKSLESVDLPPPTLPPDCKKCSVSVSATIGVGERDGGEIFYFTVVTAEFLCSQERTMWARGLLIVPEFSWDTVREAVKRLLVQTARASWREVATELNKVLCWEFDNYN